MLRLLVAVQHILVKLEILQKFMWAQHLHDVDILGPNIILDGKLPNSIESGTVL